MGNRLKVHIAGVPNQNQQQCSRCNELLINHTGMTSPLFWKRNQFVAVTIQEDGSMTNPANFSAQEHDASGPNEDPCG